MDKMGKTVKKLKTAGDPAWIRKGYLPNISETVVLSYLSVLYCLAV